MKTTFSARTGFPVRRNTGMKYGVAPNPASP
jgi:hypothetical protein